MERRAPEPLLYRVDQLVGGAPIRLRRRRDKYRLLVNLAAASALVGLSVWWVAPRHAFAGPVMVALTATHGVHVGDLPTLAFLALAARCVHRAVALPT